jgi:hypothetical protein
MYTYGFLRECEKPKLFISGSLDEFSPQESLRQVVQAAPDPKELAVVEGADHFFAGHLTEMQAAIHDWVGRLLRKESQTGTR